MFDEIAYCFSGLIRGRKIAKGGDFILTNSSIEQIAIDVIKSLANRHPLLDPAINDHEKYMAYDGSIFGFTKSGHDYKKKDWDFTVPIQVKGHVDKKNERKGNYVSKDVELTDLHIYYSEHGVGKYNDKLNGEINRYLWHFQGKCVPILIIRHMEDQFNNELADALYSRKYQTFASLEGCEDVVYITPLFVYQSAEILSNLYKYDYECFYNQIDKADINEYTIEVLNLEVLKLIKVYDICGDEHFLQIAEYLAKKLENVQHQEHYAMNRLQIKKRLGIWGEEERSELDTMTNATTEALFGKAVLLGDREKATYYFKKMSSEEQERYSEYPIFTLYEQLT